MAIPEELAVVVGVQIDESGREDEPARIDLPATDGEARPDRFDLPARDGDVAVEGGAPGTVDDARVADDEVGHGRPTVGETRRHSKATWVDRRCHTGSACEAGATFGESRRRSEDDAR
jgi:hypothetical protein